MEVCLLQSWRTTLKEEKEEEKEDGFSHVQGSKAILDYASAVLA